MNEMQYSTDQELEKIKGWAIQMGTGSVPADHDFHALMAYVKSLWSMGSWGWQVVGDTYYISTGGWSGNEDLINALLGNVIVKSLYLYSERRGGHFVFCPGSPKEDKEDIDHGIIKMLKLDDLDIRISKLLGTYDSDFGSEIWERYSSSLQLAGMLVNRILLGDEIKISRYLYEVEGIEYPAFVVCAVNAWIIHEGHTFSEAVARCYYEWALAREKGGTL